MATIPIEVIVQDETIPIEPTPTPTGPSDPGENTNITVPETGAGVVENGSNGGGIGPATNIILPAIILVLAIGAMVALLVRRQQKRKNNTNTVISKKEKLAATASSTIAVLAATVLVGNLVIPATKAIADEASNSDEGTYIETEDKVSIVATIDKDSKEPTIVNAKDILYATTDASGYTVTMSMVEGALSSNLYLNGDTESEYYIASVGGEEGGAELVNNTWGYKLDEETDGYNTVPLADVPVTIKEGEITVTHEEINVYYGLMVDNTLPLGTYSGEIEYNITPVNPIDKLTYMQDFATLTDEEKTRLLASMPEGEQYILKDVRDEKPYYISKLADGNVWMTQNLDLELSSEKTLTPADTDVIENWTPMRSTISFSMSSSNSSTSVPGWSNTETTPDSASPGDIYYYTSNSDAIDIRYNSLEECEAEHNDSTCQHYHAGNYYNWPAAVASNNTDTVEPYQDAMGSICPAGWKLPKTQVQAGDIEKNELIEMFFSYDNILDAREGNSYSYLEGGFNAIRINPIWISMAGEIFWGYAYGRGDYAIYWTNTKGRDNAMAYRLTINKSSLSTADNGSRYGKSVRCLVR